MKFLEKHHSVAIILGARSWPNFPRLNGGVAFSNSANDVQNYILDEDGLCIPKRDVLNLFDSRESAATQLRKIAQFLDRWKERHNSDSTALTGLFLYYVGHGDFISSTDFSLLVKDTDPAVQLTYLTIKALADCLGQAAPFVRQVVVLDCCFSGAAHRQWMNAAPARVVADSVTRLMPRNGTVLLCSSAENLPSLAPAGSQRTMFTEALIEALRAGSEAVPGDLTPRQARDLAFNVMVQRWRDIAVRPVVAAIDRGSGDLSDVELFPNPAAQELIQQSQRVPSQRRGKRPRRLYRYLTVAVAVTAVAIAIAVIIVNSYGSCVEIPFEDRSTTPPTVTKITKCTP